MPEEQLQGSYLQRKSWSKSRETFMFNSFFAKTVPSSRLPKQNVYPLQDQVGPNTTKPFRAAHIRIVNWGKYHPDTLPGDYRTLDWLRRDIVKDWVNYYWMNNKYIIMAAISVFMKKSPSYSPPAMSITHDLSLVVSQRATRLRGILHENRDEFVLVWKSSRNEKKSFT